MKHHRPAILICVAIAVTITPTVEHSCMQFDVERYGVHEVHCGLEAQDLEGYECSVVVNRDNEQKFIEKQTLREKKLCLIGRLAEEALHQSE